MDDILADLAYLYGRPKSEATIKARPDCFVVIEDLGFVPDGEGEHLFIRIRKTGENTRFVANELAKACGVKSKDVGWAGLKDRHAVTEQWFSVYLPTGKTPDFSPFLFRYPQIEILDVSRHCKKLRPGELQRNTFHIRLTDVSESDDVIARIEKLQSNASVPNYFGPQRFGKLGHNIDEARRWGRENVRIRNQTQRSLYLSAARSWIFNQIVSQRIEARCFDHFIEGDIALMGQEQQVVCEDEFAVWEQKLSQGEAFISAALAGDNALPTQHHALALEQVMLDKEPDLMKLIRGNRMRHERRRISLQPQQLTWQYKENDIVMDFSLDAGCYATSILRELVKTRSVKREF
jgi:tRNA pseudouridine13 synthase